MIKLHVTSVPVDDQAKALAFYTKKLGFVLKTDVPAGEFRWLTVVSPAAPDGIELLLEPMAFEPARVYQAALREAGIPWTSFAVDDLAAEYDRLTALGVEFTQEPMDAGPARIAMLDDTCGNLIQLVEMAQSQRAAHPTITAIQRTEETMSLDLSQYRLVDLTQVLVPETGPRPISIEMVNAPEAQDNGMWYIMHKMSFFLNHVGTHIESPYHVQPEGMNVAEIPLDKLCGTGIVLDLTGVAPGGVVTEEDVAAAVEAAGGMQDGDIVLCRFDFTGEPGTSRNWTAESLKYLIDRGMKLMGVDLPGVELPSGDPRKLKQYNHHQLLDNDISLIEQCANLKDLTQSRMTIFCLPIPIDKIDSFPVRLIALEDK